MEIKQHLSQNSLKLLNIQISGIWIRGEKKNKKINIHNELKLFLKQAQKRLIYLKYMKSLAWWFNYLWKPGHNLCWVRKAFKILKLNAIFFLPMPLCKGSETRLWVSSFSLRNGKRILVSCMSSFLLLLSLQFLPLHPLVSPSSMHLSAFFISPARCVHVAVWLLLPYIQD